MNKLMFCNGVLDQTDINTLLSSLSAKYDSQTDTVTIPRKEGDIVVSTKEFESVLDNWLQIGPTLASIRTLLMRIVNNTDNEAGDFVQYVKDFFKE